MPSRTVNHNPERLLAAKHAGEAADKAKLEFPANVTHELRTPLNAIIGFFEIMRDGLYRGRSATAGLD
jgi:signal transduction histidine kinase